MTLTVAEIVKDAVADQAFVDVAAISDSVTMDDLNLDSLDILEIAMTVDQSLGIELSDEDVESVRTVGDLIRVYEAKTA